MRHISRGKDEAFRQRAIEGPLWPVVLHVGYPLALYQMLVQLFKILDTAMASYISSEAVSAVAYLSQISTLLSAMGGGLAVGASLKISEAFGAGEYELVRRRVSTLVCITVVLGGAVLVLILPFSSQFLRLARTPPELIAIGSRYFALDLLSVVATMFVNVYIAIERARGRSGRLLIIYLLSAVIKLALTAFFIYVCHGTIEMIAAAMLISQLFILVVASTQIFGHNGIFSFSIRCVSFRSAEVAPAILRLSIPAMLEKGAFSLGKVIVNMMSSQYGALTVGALGVANNITGVTDSAQIGFQDSVAAVISQNLGAGKLKRGINAFKIVTIINLLVGVAGHIASRLLLPWLSRLFATGAAGMDLPFQQAVYAITRYCIVGSCIPLAVAVSVTALLLGLGNTRAVLFLNICRLFVFRIPVLLAFQRFSDKGPESVGLVMMISNIAVSLLAVIMAWTVLHKVCRKNGLHFWTWTEEESASEKH